MQLLLYIPHSDDHSKRLIELIKSTLPDVLIQTSDSLELFLLQSRQLPLNHSIAVLYVHDENDLSRLVDSQYDAYNIPSILINKKGTPDTIALGWRLKPRYMCSVSSLFDDVIAVLRYQVLKQNDSVDYEEVI